MPCRSDILSREGPVSLAACLSFSASDSRSSSCMNYTQMSLEYLAIRASGKLVVRGNVSLNLEVFNVTMDRVNKA